MFGLKPRRLHSRLVTSPFIDESIRYQCWQVRQFHLRYPSREVEEEEFAHFRELFLDERLHLIVGSDEAGRIRGFQGSLHAQAPEGHLVLQLRWGYAEYPYLFNAAQVSQLRAEIAAQVARLHPGAPIYVFGRLLLPGYIAMLLNAPAELWDLHKVGVPSDVRAILLRECRKSRGFDEATGLIRYPYEVRVFVDDLAHSEHPGVRHYLARNPRWMDGYALGVLMRFV